MKQQPVRSGLPLVACALAALAAAGSLWGSTHTLQLSGEDADATAQRTNELTQAGWRFSDMKVGEKGLYPRTKDSFWQTAVPLFDAPITNVVLRGFGSSSCTRTFAVEPLLADGTSAGAAQALPSDAYPREAAGAFTPVAFPRAWAVRGFRVVCTGGAQNAYFLSVAVTVADGTDTPAEPDPSDDPQPEEPKAPSQWTPFPLTVGGVYTQDFACLSALYPKKDTTTVAWTSGVTVAHWALYKGGEDYDGTLSCNLGTGTKAQWYAYCTTNAAGRYEEAGYALGCKVSESVPDLSAVVAFSNATENILTNFTLAYAGRQYSFPATAADYPFEVAWAVVQASGTVWRTEGDLTFRTQILANEDGVWTPGGQDPPATALGPAPLAGCAVMPGETLWLRWSRAGDRNAAGLGLDDIWLVWAVHIPPKAKVPTCLFIR